MATKTHTIETEIEAAVMVMRAGRKIEAIREIHTDDKGKVASVCIGRDRDGMAHYVSNIAL